MNVRGVPDVALIGLVLTAACLIAAGAFYMGAQSANSETIKDMQGRLIRVEAQVNYLYGLAGGKDK